MKIIRRVILEMLYMMFVVRNMCFIMCLCLLVVLLCYYVLLFLLFVFVVLGRSWEGGGEEWEFLKKDIILLGGEWDLVGGELVWYCRLWLEGCKFLVKMKRKVIVNMKIEVDLMWFKRRVMWGRERERFLFCFILLFS